jgi:hypothetical protein
MSIKGEIMRIKCRDCSNESGRKCTVKQVTINPGKHRKCDLYDHDSSREVARLQRAAAIRDRFDARQEAYRNFLAGQKNKKESTSTKHPLTGNLDKFRAGTN